MPGAYRSAASTAPAFDARDITPSDVTEIPGTRSIYVGTGGALTVRMVSGQQVTFNGVPSGTMLPIQVDKVLSTTTASQLVALY